MLTHHEPLGATPERTIALGERVLGELPWTYGKFPRVIIDE
jgi:hypothetical protein